MHGVGLPFAQKAFQAFCLKPFTIVKEQAEPDPEFPTVTYPNPEEGKGALKCAMETANLNFCNVILANDPDADRLAVAEKQSDGSWYLFNGNEIGALLGFFVFNSFTQQHPQIPKNKLYILASTVSSRFLASFAEKEGLNFVETLTGFK
jgi:phosphomannomutase